MNEFERRLMGSPGLPGLSPVAREILEASAREGVEPDALAAMIASDPSLEERVLRLVNSPLGWVGREVVSLPAAVLDLGTHAIRDLALGFCVVDALRTSDGPSGGPEPIWRASLLGALAARRLGQESGAWDPCGAFLAGLVADCGAVVMCAKVPGYRDLWARFEEGTDDLLRLEQEGLPTDHMRVGRLLLEDWGFPETLSTLIGSHHDPDPFGSDAAMESRARVLSAAWLCGRALTIPGFAAEALRLDRAVATILGLPVRTVRSITSELPAEARRTAPLFGIAVDDQRGLCELLERGDRSASRFQMAAEWKGGGRDRVDTGYDRILFSDLKKELMSTLSPGSETSMLPREAFETVLEAFHARARQARSALGLMLVDLGELDVEEFTPTGALEEIRRRIEQQTRTSDVCTRFGESRVALIVAGCERGDLEHIAERVRSSLEAPIPIGPGEVCCSVTIGVAATAPHVDGLDPRALVRLAEGALERAEGSPERILVEG